MNKELVKLRFKKNLNTYEENACIQDKMAKKLLSFLDSTKYNNILEIGCGRGLLTRVINERFIFERYTANDIVKECEKYIKEINNDITFMLGDIEQEIKNNTEKYDLIISNASFQWIENLPEFINALIQRLNNNGILLFSTFGKENFREILYTQEKQLKYYSVQELKNILEKYSPKIEEEVHLMSFKQPKEVLKHIHSTGVNAIESTFWTRKDLENFENLYNNFCSNHPTLTYNPIYVIMQKTI